jgi:methanogenic corrinoid protein MtbC1
MAEAAEPETPRFLSIGDLAEATGISPDTIRIWERRYGQPEAVRLPSGHRRYTGEQVRWLRRVAEALARGHRPAHVVSLSEGALGDLLEEAPAPEGQPPAVSKALKAIRGYKGAEVRQAMLAEAAALGPRAFVTERVAPLVTAVGRAWADGDFDVRHEHLLTGILEDVLRRVRDEHAEPRRGPTLVLATLPGERHALGLQMVALMAALAGVRTLHLGPDVPVGEIVRAAVEARARAVAISVSLATGGIQTDRTLAELRAALPAEVRLVIGGAGARGVRRGPRGVEYVGTLEALEGWLAGLR